MKSNRIFSLIDKVIYEYNLIEDGDRILIGASGGKDSTLLCEYFSNRMKRLTGVKVNPGEARFQFKALHIQSEITQSLDKSLCVLFDKWNVPYESIEINVQERLAPGKKMSCYWCSCQRRKELFLYARENGFNKIALGHHLDDVLETLIMNSTLHGELSTMTPRLKFNKFPVTVIRPLYYVGEEMIINHAEKENWKKITCTCDFQENSDRKGARQKLEILTDHNFDTKLRLLSSLKKIKTDYLP